MISVPLAYAAISGRKYLEWSGEWRRNSFRCSVELECNEDAILVSMGKKCDWYIVGKSWPQRIGAWSRWVTDICVLACNGWYIVLHRYGCIGTLYRCNAFFTPARITVKILLPSIGLRHLEGAQVDCSQENWFKEVILRRILVDAHAQFLSPSSSASMHILAYQDFAKGWYCRADLHGWNCHSSEFIPLLTCLSCCCFWIIQYLVWSLVAAQLVTLTSMNLMPSRLYLKHIL